MADILFIKTSSLGDVIHHMPALTEARAQRPGARFAWLVEETFAPLVRLHPAVAEVVPVAWRRWRKSLWSPATLREIGSHFGIGSTNGVNDHLKALESKGYLTREDMKSRSLRPTGLVYEEVPIPASSPTPSVRPNTTQPIPNRPAGT